MVHESGVRVLRANMEGNKDDCLAALAVMEDASERVIELLSQLEYEYFDQLAGTVAGAPETELF